MASFLGALKQAADDAEKAEADFCSDIAQRGAKVAHDNYCTPRGRLRDQRRLRTQQQIFHSDGRHRAVINEMRSRKRSMRRLYAMNLRWKLQLTNNLKLRTI